MRSRYHYIVDHKAHIRHRRYVRRMQVCDMISRMSLAYGGMGFHCRLYDEILAKSFWNFDGIIPSKSEVRNTIKIKNIKWYIKKHIPFQHQIWNGSYLHGISQFGDITKPKIISDRNFPILTWWSSQKLLKIVRSSPFGGRINIQSSDRMSWSMVPSLVLPFDENSLSFMAGVLSVGRLLYSSGNAIAVYNKSCEKWIRNWGIPIETTWKTGEICISPFWPCLLEKYMPIEVREWSNLKNALNANMYAAILWRIYMDEDFKSGAIPYLLGRRSIFYNYGNDNLGAMKHLEFMRIEKGLTQLDNRFRSLIHEFAAV